MCLWTSPTYFLHVHYKVSRLVNHKICSQQLSIKLINKLKECCYFIDLLHGCHSQAIKIDPWQTNKQPHELSNRPIMCKFCNMCNLLNGLLAGYWCKPTPSRCAVIFHVFQYDIRMSIHRC